jgi:hypothetical protein
VITEAAGPGISLVPRKLRHTFVALLSAHGVPVSAIALLAGHNQTATTEPVYRHQIVPAPIAAPRSWIRSLAIPVERVGSRFPVDLLKSPVQIFGRAGIVLVQQAIQCVCPRQESIFFDLCPHDQLPGRKALRALR